MSTEALPESPIFAVATTKTCYSDRAILSLPLELSLTKTKVPLGLEVYVISRFQDPHQAWIQVAFCPDSENTVIYGWMKPDCIDQIYLMERTIQYSELPPSQLELNTRKDISLLIETAKKNLEKEHVVVWATSLLAWSAVMQRVATQQTSELLLRIAVYALWLFGVLVVINLYSSARQQNKAIKPYIKKLKAYQKQGAAKSFDALYDEEKPKRALFFASENAKRMLGAPVQLQVPDQEETIEQLDRKLTAVTFLVSVLVASLIAAFLIAVVSHSSVGHHLLSLIWSGEGLRDEQGKLIPVQPNFLMEFVSWCLYTTVLFSIARGSVPFFAIGIPGLDGESRLQRVLVFILIGMVFLPIPLCIVWFFVSSIVANLYNAPERRPRLFSATLP